MKNPYIVHRPLTAEDLFFGREAQFHQLLNDLNAGHRLFFLHGKHYIGKTSFIDQLDLRLGSPYTAYRVEPALPAPNEPFDLMWTILTAAARGLDRPLPEAGMYRADPERYVPAYLASLLDNAGSAIYVIAVDAIPASMLPAEAELQRIILRLRSALAGLYCLAFLITVEGYAGILDRLPIPSLTSMALGPFSEDETDDALAVPTRGIIAYDYAAIRRVYYLTGGQPLFVQLFGQTLFERRETAGWVGLPEVDQVMDQVIAYGKTQFQDAWDSCSPAAKVVLCAFAEMIGHHGVTSAKDIAGHLLRLGVDMPVRDVEGALNELADVYIFERLGGETFRFHSELYRRWIKENRGTLETVRRIRRYRRIHVRRISPLQNRRIDWLGLFLWLVAASMVVLITLMWRSRQKGITWTAEPTPTQEAQVVSLHGIGTPDVPTPETGVSQGHIAYIAKEKAEDTWEIYVMRSDGSDPVRLTQNENNDTSPVWSPDGRRIAFVSDRDKNREIYVMNADGTEQMNLSRHANEDWNVTWSPDGKQLAFSSFRDGNWEIYTMNADGSNPKRITRNNVADYSPTWSPDGKQLAYVSNRDGNLEIYIIDANGGNQRRFTNQPATDQSPAWSPDGRQILWETYRDDNMEIYVANVDGSELHDVSQDSYANDHGPTWSPSGDRIAFFSNRDHGWDIYVLDLKTGERTNLTMSPALEQGPHWGP